MTHITLATPVVACPTPAFSDSVLSISHSYVSCMSLHVYIYTHNIPAHTEHLYTDMYICIYVYACVYVYIYICICMYVCVYDWVFRSRRCSLLLRWQGGDNSCCTGMQTICGSNSICDGEDSWLLRGPKHPRHLATEGTDWVSIQGVQIKAWSK